MPQLLDWKRLGRASSITQDALSADWPAPGGQAARKCHTPGADDKPRYVRDCPSGSVTIATPIRTREVSAQRLASPATTRMGGRRSPSQRLSSNFDHSKTKYPLLGKHATVDCIQACHVNGDFKKQLALCAMHGLPQGRAQRAVRQAAASGSSVRLATPSTDGNRRCSR